MSKRTFRIICIIALIVYIQLLIRLTVFKFPPMMTREILRSWSVGRVIRQAQTANLIPFRTIARVLLGPRLRVEPIVLMYNVAAFVPLGVLAPCVAKTARKFRAALLAGVLVSVGIELAQIVTTLGEADVDDVILNVAGTLLGCGLFWLASKLLAHSG